MGLDTFASRSPEDIVLTEKDIQAFLDADIELCGGIFSGEGGIFAARFTQNWSWISPGKACMQNGFPLKPCAQCTDHSWIASPRKRLMNIRTIVRSVKSWNCGSSSRCAASADWVCWAGRELSRVQ